MRSALGVERRRASLPTATHSKSTWRRGETPHRGSMTPTVIFMHVLSFLQLYVVRARAGLSASAMLSPSRATVTPPSTTLTAGTSGSPAKAPREGELSTSCDVRRCYGNLSPNSPCILPEVRVHLFLLSMSPVIHTLYSLSLISPWRISYIAHRIYSRRSDNMQTFHDGR